MREAINRGMPSRKFRVNRERLIGIIQNNRDKHALEYLNAIAGYKAEALRAIDREVEKSKIALATGAAAAKVLVNELSQDDLGDSISIFGGSWVNLPVPKDHRAEYDAVLSMLDLCTDDHWELSTEEHACYVMDDWDWKKEFNRISKSYTG